MSHAGGMFWFQGEAEMRRALDEVQNMKSEKKLLEKTLNDDRQTFEEQMRSTSNELDQLKSKLSVLEAELPTKDEVIFNFCLKAVFGGS